MKHGGGSVMAASSRTALLISVEDVNANGSLYLLRSKQNRSIAIPFNSTVTPDRLLM